MSKTKLTDKDREELNNYICQLFGVDLLPYTINKQIEEYTSQLEYSFSSIEKTLRYFYEFKENQIDVSRQTIGIVPYIYEEAKRFYEQAFQANQINQDCEIINRIETIKIVPQNRLIPCKTKIEEL